MVFRNVLSETLRFAMQGDWESAFLDSVSASYTMVGHKAEPTSSCVENWDGVWMLRRVRIYVLRQGKLLHCNEIGCGLG